MLCKVHLLTFGSTPGHKFRFFAKKNRRFLRIITLHYLQLLSWSHPITAFKGPFKAVFKGHAAGQASTRTLASSDPNQMDTKQSETQSRTWNEMGRNRTKRNQANKIKWAKVKSNETKLLIENKPSKREVEGSEAKRTKMKRNEDSFPFTST